MSRLVEPLSFLQASAAYNNPKKPRPAGSPELPGPDLHEAWDQHLPPAHLLLDVLDLSSQPLDHPVELHDLTLGALQVIPMSARSGLQLSQLGDRWDGEVLDSLA